MRYQTRLILCGIIILGSCVRGQRGGVRAARACARDESDRRRHLQGRGQGVAGHHRAGRRARARRRHARDQAARSAASTSAGGALRRAISCGASSASRSGSSTWATASSPAASWRASCWRTGATSPRCSSPPATPCPTAADAARNGVEGSNASDKGLLKKPPRSPFRRPENFLPASLTGGKKKQNRLCPAGAHRLLIPPCQAAVEKVPRHSKTTVMSGLGVDQGARRSTESILTFHRAERPRLRRHATPERGIRAAGMTVQWSITSANEMDSGFRRND